MDSPEIDVVMVSIKIQTRSSEVVLDFLQLSQELNLISSGKTKSLADQGSACDDLFDVLRSFLAWVGRDVIKYSGKETASKQPTSTTYTYVRRLEYSKVVEINSSHIRMEPDKIFIPLVL